MDGFNSTTLFFSLLGGILPALVWLWFWLKEDKHPEPRKLIFYAFIAGMVMVPLVVPFQGYIRSSITNATLILVLWAAVEEILKFIGAGASVLFKKENDEAIDPVIYMLTAALGFAALENVLFIIKPIQGGDVFATLITGNLRFVGATLLHVICSSAIGVAMALAFYKSRFVKFLYFLVGMGIAIALHSVFNVFIMNSTGTGAFLVFLGVWIAVIILALFFEKIKRISNQAE